MTALGARAVPAALAAGVAAALVARQPDGLGIVAAAASVVLVGLALVDVRAGILPNRVVLRAAAAVLALHVALAPDRALEWTVAALGTSLFLLVLHALYPLGLGMGDVKLGLLLGALLGRSVAPALVVGTLALAGAGLVVLVREGGEARTRTLPFAPFLAFGAVAVLLVG